MCTAFYDNDKYPDELKGQVDAALAAVEKAVGLNFGDKAHPLLVSVRSGARVSMPGMMDTVLNLGLNDITVEGLAKAANDARFAWDSYRRFIQMYGSVVMGVDHHRFEEIIEHAKLDADVIEDTALTADRLAPGGRGLQGPGPAGDRQAVPAGPARAALGRDRRGVRVLDEPSRDHLSPPARYPGRMGHRRQRAGHGVRQHG